MKPMEVAVRRKILLMVAGLLAANAATANDFPTLARVEYVMGCMYLIGNQNYDTMYQCVCSIDKIAERMPYTDYSEAQVYTMLRRTPGEKGGMFRDPPRAKELRETLAGAVEYAQSSCFLAAEK